MTRTLARLGLLLSVLASALIVLAFSSPLAVAADSGVKPPAWPWRCPD